MRSPDGSGTPGRLGAFTLLGAAAGSVPLPWVPKTLVRRVRGALVQDVASRHGLALTAGAREALSEPSRGPRPPGATREAMRFIALRAVGRFGLGPVRVLPPVRTALDTFVLGRLFERYVERCPESARRIERDEAIRVRHAIDGALVQALTAESPVATGAPSPPLEELRDDLTQAVDGALIATAGIPGWLVRRLDAAFDEILRRG